MKLFFLLALGFPNLIASAQVNYDHPFFPHPCTATCKDLADSDPCAFMRNVPDKAGKHPLIFDLGVTVAMFNERSSSKGIYSKKKGKIYYATSTVIFTCYGDVYMEGVEWKPADEKCSEYAKSINEKIRLHEQGHKSLFKKILDDSKNISHKFYASATNKKIAESLITMQVVGFKKEIEKEIERKLEQSKIDFHKTPEGKEVDIDCSKCKNNCLTADCDTICSKLGGATLIYCDDNNNSEACNGYKGYTMWEVTRGFVNILYEFDNSSQTCTKVVQIGPILYSDWFPFKSGRADENPNITYKSEVKKE